MKKHKTEKCEMNKEVFQSNVRSNVVFPTMGAAIVSRVYGNSIEPIELKKGALVNSRSESWDKLAQLSSEIGNYIAQTAMDIGESVNLVRAYGCEHPKEFHVAVQKTNEDFQRFIDDFEKIKNRHIHKTGFINTPDDLALALSIFEDYNQFRAYFEGTMQHSLISFTEYALEAKNLAVQRDEDKKAAAEVTPTTEETVISTEETK